MYDTEMRRQEGKKNKSNFLKFRANNALNHLKQYNKVV